MNIYLIKPLIERTSFEIMIIVNCWKSQFGKPWNLIWFCICLDIWWKFSVYIAFHEALNKAVKFDIFVERFNKNIMMLSFSYLQSLINTFTAL